MAQRLAKTPDELFKGAVIDSDVLMHPMAQSKKTGKLYKTTNKKTEKEAQRWANLGNKPINWADRDHNIHQKLPEQWKYKLAKTPNDLFDDMEYENIDADYERSWGPVNTPEKYAAYLKWLKGKK